jgi:hypothetical protein
MFPLQRLRREGEEIFRMLNVAPRNAALAPGKKCRHGKGCLMAAAVYA